MFCPFSWTFYSTIQLFLNATVFSSLLTSQVELSLPKKCYVTVEDSYSHCHIAFPSERTHSVVEVAQMGALSGGGDTCPVSDRELGAEPGHLSPPHSSSHFIKEGSVWGVGRDAQDIGISSSLNQ